MTTIVNPALDIKLPGNYVMPNTAPTFDYTNLIRESLSYLKQVNAGPTDFDKFYSLPQLMPGKTASDPLLAFTDDYMVPAAKIAFRLYQTDMLNVTAWQNVLNDWDSNKFSPLSGGVTDDKANTDTARRRDIIDTVPVNVAESGRIPTGAVALYTRQKLAKLTAFILARKYRKTEVIFSDILSYVEFRPTKMNKNRSEFFPDISILVTPSKTFILDIFVGTERLSTFNYGMPRYNQIVAPKSLMADKYDGTLEPKEFYQYRIGMEQAIIRVEAKIKEAVRQASIVKNAKVSSRA